MPTTKRKPTREERDALLRTLYTTRGQVERRIAVQQTIREANADLQRAQTQLDDIEQSIYWLREER